MLLVEGYGRLCLEREDGRRLTVGLIAPGELFGEEALLDVPERESAFEAILNSQIDVIPREAFTRTVKENPALLWNVNAHLAQRLREPTIPLFHKDLAAVIGVSRETVTATLNRWGTTGLTAQRPGHIILKDINRLRNMAEDADA